MDSSDSSAARLKPALAAASARAQRPGFAFG
jgi:hypothetical protein